MRISPQSRQAVAAGVENWGGTALAATSRPVPHRLAVSPQQAPGAPNRDRRDRRFAAMIKLQAEWAVSLVPARVTATRRARRALLEAPMSTRCAFILDLDGVLTDTAEYHYLAWKRLADEEGLPFTRADNEALRGVSRRESLRRLLKGRHIDEETAEAWMMRKNDYYRAFLAGITPADVLPGVHAFLAEARQRGVRLGVGSASRNAVDALAGLGLLAQIDAVGDGYSVVNTKPAPDLFLWVAGRLDVPAGCCVVFEDAEAGVQAALNAGMRCVGVGPAERVGRADMICQGLHNLSVGAVLRLLEGRRHSR
jgi:beta-phosphoglucomutase